MTQSISQVSSRVYFACAAEIRTSFLTWSQMMGRLKRQGRFLVEGQVEGWGRKLQTAQHWIDSSCIPVTSSSLQAQSLAPKLQSSPKMLYAYKNGKWVKSVMQFLMCNFKTYLIMFKIARSTETFDSTLQILDAFDACYLACISWFNTRLVTTLLFLLPLVID